MKRTFTKYPSGYVKAASYKGRWQTYYYEPLFRDRYDPDSNWSDYTRVPEGSARYAVYNGDKVVLDTFQHEAAAELASRHGITFEYPDGTPFEVDIEYEYVGDDISDFEIY